MKNNNLRSTFLLVVLLLTTMQSIEAQNNQLWYQQPAREWMEALPLGNGRLGIMVYGGVDNETIALNESSMWSGQYDENQEKEFGREKLNELRQLFFDDKIAEGNRIAGEQLKGNYNSFGTHLPIGDLKMKFTYPKGQLSNYKRALSLETAINEVSFNIGDIEYKRTCFASNPDDVIVVYLTANQPKAISLDLSLDMLRESEIYTSSNRIEFVGKVSFPMQGPGGVSFIGKIAIESKDGVLSNNKEMLSIKDASSVKIIIDVRTNYKNADYKKKCESTINLAVSKQPETLKSVHIEDYSSLYKKVELSLGESENDYLPTDVRWKRVKEGQNDVGLDALFFQYARYLLIASSRKNSPLPASLQSIWNDNLACNMSWTNDYHLDINTQQNYWLANVGNLAECHEPLFNYIDNLSKYGEKTASKVYGCRGWTAHTVANVWGYSAPSQSIYWGLFPTASSWIASHLWTQYSYTQDKKFLAEKAYPLLKGNAEFLLDYLVTNPNNGYLMTGPSISPENSFKLNGEDMPASMMPTCDIQLVTETFNSCIEASAILNIDKKFANSLKLALAKLPPVKIGKNGGIQEWFEDYEEAHPNHRHTTHLLGLYPFSQITLEKTPELAKAAEQTLKLRLAAKGWEDTEWSRTNMICFYARLKNAEEAYKSVSIFEKEFTRENLLSISPKGIAGAPYDIFIFDGNEAGAAGIAEMLVQSHEGYVEFLPALPKQWKTGYFRGLCVKGGAETDLSWKEGEIQRASIKASADNSFTVKLSNTAIPRFSKNGKTIMLKQKGDGFIHFDLKKGEVMELIY